MMMMNWKNIARNTSLICAGALIASVVTGYALKANNNDNDSTKDNTLIIQSPAKIFEKNGNPVEIPAVLYFASEQVPLWNFDTRESLDRELMVNSFFHSQTYRYLKNGARYFGIIEPILKENGIPEDFKYLALAESGFDEKALSPSGAAGFWQFLKTTGKEYGLEVEIEVDERYHIEKATLAACKYLKNAYSKFNNWTLVAASYNVGIDGVSKQMDRQKEKQYYNLLLPDETMRYVFRILALKVIMEAPSKYGFEIENSDVYPIIPFKTVEVKTEIADFADFAHKNGVNYKLLKQFNPWLRDSKLANKLGKTYQIKIPTGDFRKYDE